jgi:hypothetical protein
MATKSIDLPDGNSAVINNDPLQVHMDRLVEIQLLARKDETALVKMTAAAVAAYTESWTIRDDAGEPIPLNEEDIRALARSSVLTPLYNAIDAFLAETAPQVPNARTPRPKKSRRGGGNN